MARTIAASAIHDRAHGQAPRDVRDQFDVQSTSPAINLDASSSMRSTVSPLLRHGSAEILARISGRGPVHVAAMSQSRGSKPLSPQGGEGSLVQHIYRNRPLQAGVRPLAPLARHANQRDGEIDGQPALRRPAEDVQPVADLHFLQIAKPGIELGKAVVLAILGERPISSPSPESSTRSRICLASSFRRRGSEPDAS